MSKKKKPKKDEPKKKPQVHKDLDGFEINVDEFGQITSTMKQDKLNDFLNKNVPDKKFKDRDDLDFLDPDAKPEGEEEEVDVDPNDLPDDLGVSELDNKDDE